MADYDQSIESFPSEELSNEEQAGLVVLAAAEGEGDSVDPTVTVISPAPGSELARTGSVVFDVEDETGLADIVVWLEMGGLWEVIWGGESAGFSPLCSGSSRSAIALGYRFTVTRSGGWTAAPTFHALAFDTGGNVA